MIAGDLPHFADYPQDRHSVNPQPLLGRVVIQEADRPQLQPGIVQEFSENHLPRIPRADDQNGLPRRPSCRPRHPPKAQRQPGATHKENDQQPIQNKNAAGKPANTEESQQRGKNPRSRRHTFQNRQEIRDARVRPYPTVQAESHETHTADEEKERQGAKQQPQESGRNLPLEADEMGNIICPRGQAEVGGNRYQASLVIE